MKLVKLKTLGVFVALAFVFGSSFLWFKIALRELLPFSIVTGRLFFGSLSLGLILFLVVRPRLSRRPQFYLNLALLGILSSALPFWLTSVGEQTIDSSMAAVLESTVPLFTALLAHFFVRGERLNRRRISGLVVGSCGILVLLGPNLDFKRLQSDLGGQFALLVAALSYAASSVFAARVIPGVTPTVKTFFSIAFAAMATSIGALASERPIHLPTHGLTWMAVIFMGVVGSCLGFVLFFWLVNAVGPTRTMLVAYAVTLVGVLLGVVLLHEPLTWNLGVGAIVILLGIRIFGK